MRIDRVLDELGGATRGGLPLIDIDGRPVTVSDGWCCDALDVAARRSTPLIVVTDADMPVELAERANPEPVIAIGSSPWALRGADLGLLVGVHGPADHDDLQEAQAAAIARRFLRLATDGPPEEPTDDGSLLDVVPFAIDEPYRVEDVLDHLVDGAWLAFDRDGADEVLTAVTRIGGHSVGLAASRPTVDGGRLTPAGCARVSRLVRWCERTGHPFVSLVDTMGTADSTDEGGVGTDIDTLESIASAAATVREASPTTCAVVLGRAVGLAATVMGAVGGRADIVLPWPRARFGLRNPNTDDELATADVTRAALEGDVMDIIHPDHTRSTIVEMLELLRGREAYGDG